MIESLMFVMLHVVPIIDGNRLITGEPLPSRAICETRADILNRVDPSNYFYWCTENIE